MVRQVFVAACVLVACSKESQAPRDASQVDDGASKVDAPMIDAAPPIDALVDAAPPPSSTCAGTVSVLVDLAPSRVYQIVRVGDTLYIAAGDYDQSTGYTNTRVVPYDLTTGTPAATPLAFQGLPQLWPGDGEAWVSDYDAGSIWRLVPGMSPEVVVTGRPKPGVVVADGGYVYWSEAVPPSNEQTVIRRRLITGGTVDPVTTCDSPSELTIFGNDLYCAEFSRYIKRAPKAGGASVQLASVTDYPIPSMTRDGADLFFVTLKPTAEVIRVPTPNGPEVLVKELTTVARFSGIAVSPSFIYITGDPGVRRIHRATNLLQTSYNGTSCAEDPVLWNNELVFVKKDSQVLRCVD